MLKHTNISMPYICNRNIAAAYVIFLSVYLKWMPLIMHFSIEKFIIMSLAPLIFIFKVPYISKALIWGGLYWLLCFFLASFQSYMRFSTLVFSGMYIISFVVYYNLIEDGAFTLDFFMKLMKWLIIAFGIVLVLQQIAMLVGVHSFILINLDGDFKWSITKLPSLSAEPSSTARAITVAMLAYLRCMQIKNGGEVVTFRQLFLREHRWVTILYLWSIFTMGSGTGFIGLGLLCLYFITMKNWFYIIPVIIAAFLFAQTFQLKQMDRATRTAEATLTGDVTEIEEADGSAASRVTPMINTFTKTDLTDITTWTGKGTVSKLDAFKIMVNHSGRLGIIDQYGLIAFALSLILVYTCMIRRFFSLETLLFFFLLGMSIGNIFYTWGCMMIFTAVRYFQVQDEKGLLKINKTDESDNSPNFK